MCSVRRRQLERTEIDGVDIFGREYCVDNAIP